MKLSVLIILIIGIILLFFIPHHFKKKEKFLKIPDPKIGPGVKIQLLNYGTNLTFNKNFTFDILYVYYGNITFENTSSNPTFNTSFIYSQVNIELLEFDINTNNVSINCSEILNSQNWVYFYLNDNSTYQNYENNVSCSYIGEIINLLGPINEPPFVEEPKTLDENYNGKSFFNELDKVIIRVNVTDPQGASDIDKVLIEIIDNSSIVRIANETMTNVESIPNGYTYEFNYTLPSYGPSGIWTIKIYANDTYGESSYNKTTFSTLFPLVLMQNISVEHSLNRKTHFIRILPLIPTMIIEQLKHFEKEIHTPFLIESILKKIIKFQRTLINEVFLIENTLVHLLKTLHAQTLIILSITKEIEKPLQQILEVITLSKFIKLIKIEKIVSILVLDNIKMYYLKHLHQSVLIYEIIIKQFSKVFYEFPVIHSILSFNLIKAMYNSIIYTEKVFINLIKNILESIHPQITIVTSAIYKKVINVSFSLTTLNVLYLKIGEILIYQPLTLTSEYIINTILKVYQPIIFFQQRIKITINNTLNSHTLNNYPLLIKINTSNIGWKSVFPNIKITLNNGAEIPYWIEYYNKNYCLVWVKIQEIPANGYVTIYIYPSNNNKNYLLEIVNITLQNSTLTSTKGGNYYNNVPIFQKPENENTYLIGYSNDLPISRYWNGSTWVDDSSFAQGLNYNGAWHGIFLTPYELFGEFGILETSWYGSVFENRYKYWNGSTWVDDSSKLPPVDNNYVSYYFVKNNKSKIIMVKRISNIEKQYYWNGSEWIEGNYIARLKDIANQYDNYDYRTIKNWYFWLGNYSNPKIYHYSFNLVMLLNKTTNHIIFYQYDAYNDFWIRIPTNLQVNIKSDGLGNFNLLNESHSKYRLIISGVNPTNNNVIFYETNFYKTYPEPTYDIKLESHLTLSIWYKRILSLIVSLPINLRNFFFKQLIEQLHIIDFSMKKISKFFKETQNIITLLTKQVHYLKVIIQKMLMNIGLKHIPPIIKIYKLTSPPYSIIQIFENLEFILIFFGSIIGLTLLGMGIVWSRRKELYERPEERW